MDKTSANLPHLDAAFGPASSPSFSRRAITPTQQQATLARFFSAISHKRRLMIFSLLLQEGPKGLSHEHLLILTKMATSTLGHHLRQMEIGNLLSRQQRGNRAWFAINFTTLNVQLGQFSRAVQATRP